MAQTFNPKKDLEYELKVGEFLEFKKNSFFDESFQVAYAGMPSKEVFSMIYSFGNSDANFFFPLSKKFNLYKKSFEILEVNPEKIKLKYLEEK